MTEAVGDKNESDRDQRLKAADKLRKEMERHSLEVRDLILAQPPVQLLGYLWSLFHINVLAEIREKDEDYRPNKELIQSFQFALEYVHAVWSCHKELTDEKAPLDQAKAATLFEVLDDLKSTTMMYCMASSAANIAPEGNQLSPNTEFHAKSSWVLIRGNRYQVLEEEFFKFVLAPHVDALRAVYGMEPDAIAASIQAIANSIRTGFGEAVRRVKERMDQTQALVDDPEGDLGAAIEKLKKADSSFASEMSGAMRDIFFGGTCNLSRHTDFTPILLEDLSYSPGENTEFFADGEFKGTPMRTLPARVKPGIKLNNEYYATDGQFVRDSAYRAIQRGLLARAPQYREEWNKRQKTLIEQSYPTIFSKQLAAATKYSEVYFRDSKTGQWAETDLIMALDDVLLIIEAKAGVMAMHSPATNFDRHERAIRELIVKAYDQCRRFVEYLASAPEVPIYNRLNGQYAEVGKLRQRTFRAIFPIGLTVEAFTPFSAMSKELTEIRPLLGRHALISMSVDDLFVLNRFLPTTGELLHYLEVRQQVACIPNALLYDEIEHLGAYIVDNRFDMSIRNQLKKADMVTWDSFGDVVDKHFEGDTWIIEPAPRQEYPQALAEILEALDKRRPVGWLEMDSFIRNFGGDGRNNLANCISELRATLHDHPIRRFLLGGENPLQVWLCQGNAQPSPQEMRYQAEVGCLAAGASKILVLCLSYDEKDELGRIACFAFGGPLIVQINYGELMREAKRQRVRMVKVGNPIGRSKKKPR